MARQMGLGGCEAGPFPETFHHHCHLKVIWHCRTSGGSRRATFVRGLWRCPVGAAADVDAISSPPQHSTHSSPPASVADRVAPPHVDPLPSATHRTPPLCALCALRHTVGDLEAHVAARQCHWLPSPCRRLPRASSPPPPAFDTTQGTPRRILHTKEVGCPKTGPHKKTLKRPQSVVNKRTGSTSVPDLFSLDGSLRVASPPLPSPSLPAASTTQARAPISLHPLPLSCPLPTQGHPPM